LSGGDDYELLFSLPPDHKALLETWSQQLDIRLSIIGVLEEDEGIRCFSPDGSLFDTQRAGFEHFSHKA
jgi:thiamine-monophosphate kinase